MIDIIFFLVYNETGDIMVDLKDLQKQVYENKVNKGFNTTDIPKEFCKDYVEAENKTKNDLYKFVNDWLKENPIYNEFDTIDLCESNCDELHYFVQGIMNIIGYSKGE